MNPRLLRPLARRQAPAATHLEALDWASRVTINGGSVSTETLAAVSAFCNAIDTAGIRDRFGRLNLFAGTGISAALVPLYRGTSRTGTQYGGATDTNSNFVSDDYLETGATSGLTGDGVIKYLNTGYPANTLPANNTHLGVGLLGNDPSEIDDRTLLGAWDNAANIVELRERDRGGAVPRAATLTRYGTSGDRFGDDITAFSLAVGNIVAAWPTMYRNGVSSGADATSSQNFPNATNLFVFALNQNSIGALNRTASRLGWYSIGATMTASQALSYHNALVAFNTTLSRT
jgi:hypothetical protein